MGQTGLSSGNPSLVHLPYSQVGGSQLDPNTFKGNQNTGRAGLPSGRPATPAKESQNTGQAGMSSGTPATPEGYPTASPPGLAGNRNQVGLSSGSPNMIADQLYINPKSTHNGLSSGLPPPTTHISSISAGTQTETSLPSTARSITWIPVAEEIQPIYDADAGDVIAINHQQDEEQLEKLEDILAECGDVLWFISELARIHNKPLSELASENIAKLQSRKQRGKLKGNGDKR